MSIKTIAAKSITRRVGFIYAGTAAAPVTPVHATAYKRTEGTITIALVKGGVVEVRTTERVRVAYSPEGIDAVGLRWCRTCPETHLLRVGTDKAATLYCDARTKVLTTEWDTLREQGVTNITAFKAEQRETERAAERDARIAEVMAIRPKTRDELVLIALRNVARASGLESARFATVATEYRVDVEQAKAKVADMLLAV